jgi:hypothetical protein
MITIDFSIAIALFALLFIVIILALWFISRKDKDKDISLDQRFIWFCSICTYTYVNTKEDTFSTCPRCGSYNKR